MNNGKLAEKIRTDRRGLLKGLLTAGFAAPVIATFTMDSLRADSNVLAVSTASNTTQLTACPVNAVSTALRQLPNVGYTGPMFFYAHLSEMAMQKAYLTSANLPQPVTTLCPAAPSRLTTGVTLQVSNNGQTTIGLRYQHIARNDLSIVSAIINVNGQSVCSLAPPMGQITSANLPAYPDTNGLLADLAAGRALLEMSVLFMGGTVNLIGTICSSAGPVNMNVMTS